MGRVGLIGLLIAVVTVGFASAAELPIVQDGKSEFVIAFGHGAAQWERDLAAEVSKYIERMSGARLPVKPFDQDGHHQILIMTAHGAAPEAGDAITVQIQGDNVFIGSPTQLGLFRACYAFLDQLGCRFLAPGFDHYKGSAEFVPAKKTLVLTEGPLRGSSRPQLKFRKLYVEEGHSHTAENLKQLVEWMPKAGYNTLVIPTNYAGHDRVKWDNWRIELTPELQKRGITIEVGGHGYENFINAEMQDGKLFAEHQDWFGQDESGQRVKAKNRVFCTSNAQAVDFVVGNVVAYLKDRPEIQIFDFWPPDGAKWCACDDCKKLGTPPDRQAILLKQVTEKLKPIRPDIRLEVIAYSSYLQPPANQAVDPSVLVDFCPINQQFDFQIGDSTGEKNRMFAEALAAWRKKFSGDISIYSYYRKYAWDSLPVIIPRYMQRDLNWYATLPTQGVSVYSEPGDWGTYELNHYVLGKLAWDSNIDVNAVVNEFAVARYGEECGVAKNAFAVLEKNVRMFGSVPHTTLKSAEETATARDAVAATLKEIKAAKERAKKERVKQALNRLALSCEYAAKDLEIQHLRATKAPREQIIEKATTLHAWVKSHADDGVFLIMNRRLNLNRMLTRYGVGQK